MSERKKGIPEALLEQGVRAASRAAKAVLEDPRGQEVLAAAVGAAQKGKRQVEEIQGQGAPRGRPAQQGRLRRRGEEHGPPQAEAARPGEEGGRGGEALTGWGLPGILRGHFGIAGA